MKALKDNFNTLKCYLHRTEEINLSNKIVGMLKPLCDGKNMRLLEVGCSNGGYAIDRSHKLGISEVYGVDLGRKRLEEAKQKGVITFECDIEEEPLPFDNDSFDIIICNQVLEHLKKIHFLMDECHRVLKKDGLFVVSVPNLAALHNRLLLFVGKQPTTLQVFSEHVRGFAPDAFKSYLTFNNLFKLIRYSCSGFYPFPPQYQQYYRDCFQCWQFSK